MSDYSKQTVAQLRQLLKDRGIPSTGLQRKAQIIERLEEADNEAPEAAETTEEKEENENTPSDAVEPATATPPLYPDPPPETTPQVDENVPLTDSVPPLERPTADTTVEAEPGANQSVRAHSTPRTDSSKVSEPKAAEPSDAEAQGEQKDEHVMGELPDAPEQVAETSQFTQRGIEISIEQSQSATANTAPSPTLAEKPSVEKSELLPIPERSTAETSRLNTEELEADSRKRKRRSATPELPSQDIRAKKYRPAGEPVPEVYLKEDLAAIAERRQSEQRLDDEDSHSIPIHKDSKDESRDAKREKKENSSRYRNLIDPGKDDPPIEAAVDDRPTVPAVHPVTSALYIRDFMRPLRPELLRTHLISLASPPSGSPDPTILKSLFLDAMKTHALVSFATTTAASRARVAIHGSIWPPEGNRKELWADFVPDELVQDWIREEENAVLAEKEARANGRSLAPKRFEVVYPESSDGTIVAVFQEVSSNPLSTASRGPQGSVDARRPSTQHPAAPSTAPPSKDTRQDIEASFKTLDQLFRSTEAKPQLFYLPVSDEISDARLKELDQETSRDWTPVEVRKGRGIKSEIKYKYSFDDEDRIVEVGEDGGPWSERSSGYGAGRGGYRGRGGRGRGGGYRGRGGDSWRT